MAKTVDELLIKIKADTRELEAKLKKAQGSLKTTGATGVAAFGGAGLAGSIDKIPKAAVAATVAIAGIGVAVSKIAQAGMQFEDLKDSLDQVFGSIEAGDAAMDKVFTFAQTTPFQIEDATKAFIALKSAGIEPNMEMLQTFADTASVSVDQLGTFEALVRTVQRSASGGMGLEELNMISDRGIDVLGILRSELNLGKDDIAKFGKTAEGAAIIVEALVKGLQEKFGGAMEAKMDNLSTKSSNMTIAFKQLADEVFKSGLGDFLKDMADRLTEMANAAGKLVRTVTGNQNAVDLTGATDPKEQLEILRKLRAEEQAEVERLQSITGPLGNRLIGDDSPRLLRLKASIEEIDGVMRELGMTFIDTGKQVFEKFEVFEPSQKFIEFMPELKRLANDASDPLEEVGNQIALIQEILDSDDVEKFAEFYGLTKEELEGVQTHLEGVKTELSQTTGEIGPLQDAVQDAANTFSNDFVQAIMSGQDALASFEDFSRNIVSQIISTFLQLGVVNEILNAIFPQLNLDTLGMFNGKAGGGTVQRNSPVLVGERGPEIFVPNTGGTVMNNMNSKNAMGGGSVNIYQNLNFATGVVPTVRAEVTKMLPQIAEVTKGAVQEQAMRGGSYRRSLLGG